MDLVRLHIRLGYLSSGHLVKVNNENTSAICEIISKLTKTLERRQWRRSGGFIVNFERFCGVSIVHYGQVNVYLEIPCKRIDWFFEWVNCKFSITMFLKLFSSKEEIWENSFSASNNCLALSYLLELKRHGNWRA